MTEFLGGLLIGAVTVGAIWYLTYAFKSYRPAVPKQKPEFDYAYIPKEHMAKFAKLFDAMMNSAGKSATYQFWEFVGQILPGNHGEICWLSHTRAALRSERQPGPERHD